MTPTAPPGVALVHVDRIGTVTPEGADDGALSVLVLGATDAIRGRLERAGCRVLEESDGAAADAVVLSTRLPRAELTSHIGELLAVGPVVALAHTGGERSAVDVMRAGAVGVIAEGNEAALHALVRGDGHDTGLLEVYERQVAGSRGRDAGRSSTDPVTGLPARSAFDTRVADASVSGDVPRISLARIVGLGKHDRSAPPDAAKLLRQRLAVHFRSIAAAYGVEVYTLDAATFGFVGDTLSPNRTEQLGAALARAAERYAPDGRPLAVALGHAGSEVGTDPSTLCQLAERAADVAALEQRSTVVGAETLALGVSSTTELEAALRVVAWVEDREHRVGRGERVSELAGELAWELGYEGVARTRIQLAAQLQGVGRVGLPPDALVVDESTPPDLLALHREHPTRAAAYLGALAGPEVAAAVRGHHERWDGAGFPDGLAGEAIPIGARILAVVNAFDRTVSADGLSAALAVLAAERGTALDPTVVDVAVPALAGRLRTATAV